jgi:hypothetical protein
MNKIKKWIRYKKGIKSIKKSIKIIKIKKMNKIKEWIRYKKGIIYNL